MSDLIDREALKEALPYVTMSVWIGTSRECRAYNKGLAAAKQAIADAPAVDAVPVVRGYSYEDDKTYSGPGTSNYICSVCGEMQGTWKKGLTQNQKFKFCPWCGAKMDKDAPQPD